MITADVFIRILHGMKLLLRGIRWTVSDQPTEFVLIRRKVFESTGCVKTAFLEAACNSHDVIIIVTDILGDSNPTSSEAKGTIAAMYGENYGVYHDNSGAEFDVLNVSKVYIDIGDVETPE